MLKRKNKKLVYSHRQIYRGNQTDHIVETRIRHVWKGEKRVYESKPWSESGDVVTVAGDPIISRQEIETNRLTFRCDHILTQNIIDEASKHQDINLLEFRPSRLSQASLPFIEDSLDLSSFSTCSNLTEVRIYNVYGTIDLSPLRNLETLVITPQPSWPFYFSSKLVEGSQHGTDDKEIHYFQNRVILPESKHLKSVTIHGGVEYDKTTMANYPELEEFIIEHPKEEDWSWLSHSRSIKTLEMWNTFPQRVILPGIESLKKLEISVKKYQRGRKFLREIDLSSLGASKNLEELIMRYQQIPTIDFTPLSSCKNLTFLDMRDCGLSEVDLSPLSGLGIKRIYLKDNQIRSIILPAASHLHKLNLSKNLLQKIDLGPLASSHTLEWIDLRDNQLLKLDLKPLSGLKSLEELSLMWNRFEELDLSPLSSIPMAWDITPNKNLKILDVTPLLQFDLRHFVYRGIKLIASKEKRNEIKSEALRKIAHKIEWY